MRIGLQIPDFTWPGGPTTMGEELARIARTADQAGFDMLAVMDHFFPIPVVGPPEHDMLEAYTTLGFLAAHTRQAKLITVITGVAYRHPGILAKIVSTLDVLSGGRAWLGIGAAWNDQEARGLGVPFPPLAERFERLEEALRICLLMWSTDETPFEGKHYRLERPLNVPQPLTKPHPPIMIGGGGERKTLRLVAKYADACNLFATPELEHKLEVLRDHCEREGRNYDDIEKTVYFPFEPGENGEGVGPILDRLSEFAKLGIGTVIGNVADVWRITPLEIMGEKVIPEAAKL
jgi:F420-dependent oxidoreductase-like protein